MSEGWNFERRRDACARFLIGVFALTKGLADKDTSLEAVRSRMRLSPEEALFAARRLRDEQVLTFEAAGPVRSSAAGIERARSLLETARGKTQRFDDVTRTLHDGGAALAMLVALIRAEGSAIECGAPDGDETATYRLALVDDVVTIERRLGEGAFETATPGARL